MKVEKPLEVLLANRGNPDFGQDPDRPLYGTPRDRWHAVADYAEASRLASVYIRRHNLGMGSWTGGNIRRRGTREIVAYVALNGGVYQGNRDAPWYPGKPLDELLFKPTVKMLAAAWKSAGVCG